MTYDTAVLILMNGNLDKNGWMYKAQFLKQYQVAWQQIISLLSEFKKS